MGTDKPAYEPWFSDDDPTNGKGYESAVAYAVAEKLGFARTRSPGSVPFTNAYAPGRQEVRRRHQPGLDHRARRKAVDFSTGYYDVAQAVVTTRAPRSPAPRRVAGLKTAKLGAQVGTTSYTAINDQIQPDARSRRSTTPTTWRSRP